MRRWLTRCPAATDTNDVSSNVYAMRKPPQNEWPLHPQQFVFSPYQFNNGVRQATAVGWTLNAFLLPLVPWLLLWPSKARPLYFTAVIYFILFLFSQRRRKTSHAIWTKLAQYGRSEVVSIYKCPNNFGGPLFSRLPQSIPNISGTKRRIDKQNALSIYNVSPKGWPTFRVLWPRNGWVPFRHCNPPYGGHYVATIIVATCLVCYLLFPFPSPLLPVWFASVTICYTFGAKTLTLNTSLSAPM